MKNLTLIRHAKSDWSSGANSDFDRRLNARGKKKQLQSWGGAEWLKQASALTY